MQRWIARTSSASVMSGDVYIALQPNHAIYESQDERQTSLPENSIYLAYSSFIITIATMSGLSNSDPAYAFIALDDTSYSAL